MELTSNYQYIGRSNGVLNYGGGYRYYLLLYAKTEPNTAAGKHKVSLKMRIACQGGDGFYGYSTTGYAKVEGAEAIGWSKKPVPNENDPWTTGSLTEGGVTYSRWVGLKEGSTDVDTGFGSSKNVTIEASFQRQDMDKPPAWVPITTAMTISTEVTLPAIAQASKPTVSQDTVQMGTEVTIYTHPSSDSFTHKLTYSMGGKTGDIASNVTDSCTWTPPKSLAAYTNKQLTATCTITCETFVRSQSIGTATTTLTLQVPNATVPTMSKASIRLGESIGINMPRETDAYVHDLSYELRAEGSNTVVDYGKFAYDVGTYHEWVDGIKYAEFLPNSAKGTFTIICTTKFKGSSTVVYEDEKTSYTVIVPENEATLPTASMTIAPAPADSSLRDPFKDLYIQNLTKLNVKVTGVGKYEATISETKVTVGGSTYNGGVLTKSGNVNVTGIAIDSRGYAGSTSESIDVIPYSKPAIVPADGQSEIVCKRCDKDGKPTDSGTYLRIIAKRSYSPITVDGEQKNFCVIQYRVNNGDWVPILAKDAATNWVDTGAIPNLTLSATDSYTVDVGVVDEVGQNAYVTKKIPTDKVDLHLMKNGGGVAFGGYCQRPGFTCYMDAYFFGSDKALADYVVEEGTRDNWFYRKWYSGIAECWGRHMIDGQTPITDSWGTLYCSGELYFSYPSGLFAYAPYHVSIETAYTNGKDFWLARKGIGTVERTDSVFFVTASAGNVLPENSTAISVHALGTWE